ncbi:MAG: hypothetical protein J6331_04485 [Lentisphaeria bacterium]|nr:hypothetical protein [Lentisphaeria bacterium]
MAFVAFLKKHYEKLILGFLLLVFIGLLINLGILVRTTKRISVEGGNDDLLQANYKKQAGEMRAEKEFSGYSKWAMEVYPAAGKDEKSRIVAEKYSGDFIIPAALTICPNCRKAIPVSDFKIKTVDGQLHCSLRGHVLEAPTQIFIEDEGKDSDKDGIPDEYEKRYQEAGISFNMKDRRDASLDFDNDYFTNLEEYVCDTDPLNPKPAPGKKGLGGNLKGRLPYWYLLSCGEVARRRYSFVVTNINKEKGSVTVKVMERRMASTGALYNVPRNRDIKVGGQFTSLNENMKVLRIEERAEQRRKIYSVVVKDLFSGDEFAVEKNVKSVLSPVCRATLNFRGNASWSKQVKEGMKISFGNDITGMDTYTVMKIDEKERVVQLKDEAGAVVSVRARMAFTEFFAKKKAEKDAKSKSGPKEVRKARQ